MKTLAICILLTVVATAAQAWETYDPYNNKRQNNPNYQQDNYGNYTKRDNMYRDSDGDGVSNRYDYNDRNPNVQRQNQYNPYNSYGTTNRSQRNQYDMRLR